MNKTKSQVYQRCTRAIASVYKYTMSTYKNRQICTASKKEQVLRILYHCLPRFDVVPFSLLLSVRSQQRDPTTNIFPFDDIHKFYVFAVVFLLIMLFSNSRYSFFFSCRVSAFFCCAISWVPLCLKFTAAIYIFVMKHFRVLHIEYGCCWFVFFSFHFIPVLVILARF